MKAFDTVSRKGLWQILERHGYPRKFLNMVIQLHEGQRDQIRLEGDLSESFPNSNGVKQGFVLAPTLFSIVFRMMIKQVNEDLEDEDGVYVRYRLDGSLFNIRRFQALSSSHQDSWEAYQGPSLPWLPTQKVPKVVLYGELSTRHRDRGAPKKRYQVCLKKSLIVCHIDCQQWSDKAVDRDAWRHTVHKAASLFEENRRDSLKDKRQRRKAQAASTTENPDLTYMCRHCTRTCLSRIGLLSHERACSRRGQQPSWSSFAKSSQTKHDSDFSSKRSMRYISLIWLLNSVLAELEWAKINRVIRDIHNFIILYCKNLHCIVYTCSSFQFFFSYSFFLFFFLVNVYLMISSIRLD